MSSVTIIPLAILAAVLLCTIAFGPTVWLTRSSHALGVRCMSGGALVAAWVVAAVPWTAVLLYLRYRQHFSISVDGILQTVGIVVVVVLTIVLLFSLPLTVIVLSIMRFLDRKAVITR